VTVTKDALPASSPTSPEYRVLSAGIFALIVGIAFEFMIQICRHRLEAAGLRRCEERIDKSSHREAEHQLVCFG